MAAADLPNSSPFAALGQAMERPVVVPSIGQIYADNFRYVWRCLRALGIRDVALDDAVQDVFLVVQKKLGQFDGKGELRTWLYAIALRVARRYRAAAAEEAQRRSAESQPHNQDEPGIQRELPDQADTERTFESGERLDLARRALDKLDDAKREVFVLRHVEQMSAPEIAEAIGIPLNTVYSRLRAARFEFRTHVARLEPRRVR
jgi:RNA polymerase sigma-70 factor (ECF subfamily)